jgi:hypothetical protein
MDIDIVRTSELEAGVGGYKVTEGVIQIVAGIGTPESAIETWKSLALVREDPRFRDGQSVESSEAGE